MMVSVQDLNKSLKRKKRLDLKIKLKENSEVKPAWKSVH